MDSVWFVEWSEDGGRTWNRWGRYHDDKDEADKFAAPLIAKSKHRPYLYRVSEYRRVPKDEGK